MNGRLIGQLWYWYSSWISGCFAFYQPVTYPGVSKQFRLSIVPGRIWFWNHIWRWSYFRLFLGFVAKKASKQKRDTLLKVITGIVGLSAVVVGIYWIFSAVYNCYT